MTRGAFTWVASMRRTDRLFKPLPEPLPARAWQRFLAWDDFLRLGCSAGVYPRRILAGAAANGRWA